MRSTSMTPSVLAGVLLLSVLGVVAPAQVPGPTLRGPVPDPSFFQSPDFGGSLATLTDAAGATTGIVTTGDQFSGFSSTTTLELYETNGTLRWTRPPPAEFSGYFGAFLTGVPDLNGDLVDDVLVGLGFSERAEVLSGADGSRLDLLSSPTPLLGNSFGHRVASLGDLDKDGFVEFTVEGDVGLALYRWVGGASVFVTFLAGIHAAALPGPVVDELVVESSFDTRFYTLSGTQLTQQRSFPQRSLWIVPAGDVTGDGRVDLVLNTGIDVSMVDGATLNVVWAKDDSGYTLSTGFAADGGYGNPIVAGQDLNGNGVPDVAVGDSFHRASNPLNAEGAVFVYEGSTGQELAAVFGTVQFSSFGGQLALASTFLGSQVGTLLVGLPRPEAFEVSPAKRPGEIRGYRFLPSAAPIAPAPVLQVDRIDDEYTVSGAPPTSIGFLGASTGTTTLGGQTVIDFNPPALLGVFPIAFDADGVFRLPLPVGGFPPFHLQVIDARPVLSRVTKFDFF